MAYNNDRYADPYQQNQYHSQTYDQNNTNYPYPSETQYPAQHRTPDETYSYQEPEYYPSTDKINVNDNNANRDADYNTSPVIERERKGRQNIGAGGEGGKSWANGPPPRSTGILRMWRKDERGKQWTRVSELIARVSGYS